MPLQKWFLTIYLCGSYKKGISSIQLSQYVDVIQKTAWFMLQRIRYVFKNHSFELLDREVEMDETYVGGTNKNKHSPKKSKQVTGRDAQGFASKGTKVSVVGMVERGGQLRAVATKDMGSNTRMALTCKHIDIDTSIYTDEHMPYRMLPKIGFKHESVNHGIKEFVNGIASTNIAKSFWSHWKPGINGTYYHVSAKHLQRCCNEYNYRWKYPIYDRR